MVFKKVEKEKKEIFVVLIVIGTIIFLFLWRFVFSSVEPSIPPVATTKTAPRIDFEFVESKKMEEFQKYETIDSLEEDLMGRENPFLPF